MTLMDRLRGISAPDETMPDMEAPWKRTRSLDDLEPTEMLSPSIDPDALLLNMKKLEQDLNRNRLDEIAQLVRDLTYGEMMTFAKAVADIVAAQHIEIGSLTDDAMASVLHRWSTNNG